MAPGFVLHTAHPDYPETSRERWLDNLFNHLRIDEWEQTNISAHTYGDVGVVTSAYRWSGSMYEQPFDAKGHCTDVWQLRDPQWQVVSRMCMAYLGVFLLRSRLPMKPGPESGPGRGADCSVPRGGLALLAGLQDRVFGLHRSEERRVGKELGRT